MNKRQTQAEFDKRIKTKAEADVVRGGARYICNSAGVITKVICTRCRKALPATKDNWLIIRKGLFASWCRACDYEYKTAYREAKAERKSIRALALEEEAALLAQEKQETTVQMPIPFSEPIPGTNAVPGLVKNPVESQGLAIEELEMDVQSLQERLVALQEKVEKLQGTASCAPEGNPIFRSSQSSSAPHGYDIDQVVEDPKQGPTVVDLPLPERIMERLIDGHPLILKMRPNGW